MTLFGDVVVLFFVLGLFAGLAKTDLKLPDSLYESLSIFLLLTIGLKGGIHLGNTTGIAQQLVGVIAMGIVIPLLAFGIVRRWGRFSRPDAAAIAAHYGSVSAVTFAVVLEFLRTRGVPFENHVVLFMVILEVPAIAVAILLARQGQMGVSLGRLTHEVLFNKSIFLLIGGLAIGAIVGEKGLEPLAPVFFGGFKAALAFFLLEMGAVASRRLADLRQAGPFLASFAIAMPLLGGFIGAFTGTLIGLSVGGTTVLATLAGSASYIAATAAVRIAIPQANPTYYVTASLGVTFPFNITLGIPIYWWMAQQLQGLMKAGV